MLALNCFCSTLMTKAFIQHFKQRFKEKYKRSLIIFNCAGASIAPTPYLQTYSASKIFNEFMTMGLHHEIKDDGVDVMGIKSFGIKNEKSQGENSILDQFLNVTAEKSVKASLDKC